VEAAGERIGIASRVHIYLVVIDCTAFFDVGEDAGEGSAYSREEEEE
jgi:hypothetical protein